MSNTHVLVRLLTEVKIWLKKQAEANSSTMTAEVVRSIRERIERTERLKIGSSLDGKGRV